MAVWLWGKWPRRWTRDADPGADLGIAHGDGGRIAVREEQLERRLAGVAAVVAAGVWRAASQRSRAAPWHFGQCRLRQEL